MQDRDDLEQEKLRALQQIRAYLRVILACGTFGVLYYIFVHTDQLQEAVKKFF